MKTLSSRIIFIFIHNIISPYFRNFRVDPIRYSRVLKTPLLRFLHTMGYIQCLLLSVNYNFSVE